MSKNKKFRWDGRFIKFCELFLDILIVILGFLIVYSLEVVIEESNTIHSFLDYYTNLQNYLIIPSMLVANSLYLLILIVFFTLYRATAINNTYFKTMTAVVLSFFIATITIIVVYYLFDVDELSMHFILGLFLIEVILFSIWKYLLHKFLNKRIKKSCLFFGSNLDIQLYLSKFKSKLNNGKTLKYVYEYKEGESIDNLFDYLKEIDLVYLLPNVRSRVKNQVIKHCIAQNDIEIAIIPQMYEVGITNSKIENVDDVMIYKMRTLHLSLISMFFKRVVDLFVSTIALVVLSPVFLVVYILIKLFDKGPAIYKQERVTYKNRKYMLYKFRTMKVDAEKKTGAVWASQNDNRITKVGKFLRKTRFDEIPQFVNVFKGDMTLVGPRPERPIFVKEFQERNPDFQYRLNVKAGITGLAQVYGKYNTSPDDKLRYDLYYISNYSPLLDLKIVFLTIKTVFDKEATNGVDETERVVKNKDDYIMISNKKI